MEGRETQRPVAQHAQPVPLVWLRLSKRKTRQAGVKSCDTLGFLLSTTGVCWRDLWE